MNVVVEDAGPCRKVMQVTAPPDATAGDYADVLNAYTRSAAIPGFRRGKAPAGVVERRYARELVEDVKDRAVPRLYREALGKEGLNPVAIVSVSDVSWEKEKGIAFKVMLDTAPSFKLPKYRKIAVAPQAVTVTDAQVETALEDVRRQFARFQDVDGRPVQEHDLVKIDYAGTCDGQAVSAAAPGAAVLDSGKDFHVLVGGQELIPGLAQGLIGMQIGARRSIAVTFPEQYHIEALRGRAAAFDVEVKGIRERVIPPLDAEMVKSLGVDSEQAVRDRIRAQLLEAAEQRERQRRKDDIAKTLLERTAFDLPQSIVEEETNLAIRSIVARIMRQGASRTEVEKHRDSILTAASQTSKDRVKLTYILARIADEEGIAVSDEELEARLAEMAARYQMTAEAFRGELAKRNSLESLRSDIRQDKTMDFLLENAQTT